MRISASMLITILLVVTAHAQVQFEDKTARAGFTYWGESWGASWGDLNGDGLPDIFVTHHRAKPSLHINQGNGTFKDITATTFWNKGANVSDMHGGSWADFDNDGDQDFYVTHGSNHPNHFMVNKGGILTHQTAKYDLGLTKHRGRMPVWLDFNADGLLDYLVTSENAAPLAEQAANSFIDRTSAAKIDCNGRQLGVLADVTGNGSLELICTGSTFPDRVYDIRRGIPFTQLKGVMPVIRASLDVAIGDFDNNLKNDFFLVRGNKRLSGVDLLDSNTVFTQLVTHFGREKRAHFKTNGNLTITLIRNRNFTNEYVSIGAKGWHPDATVKKVRGEHTMVLKLSSTDPKVVGIAPHKPASDRGAFIGYDPETQTWTIISSPGGKFTYLIAEAVSTRKISNVHASGLDSRDNPVLPALVSGKPGGFRNITAASGLDNRILCVSAVAADFDNDMDMDIYAVCRGAVLNRANRYFNNNGDGTFTLVTGAGGAAGPVGGRVGKGENVVTADYDLDGNVDLFVTNGLAMNPERVGGPDQLFRNTGHPTNNWIQFDLVGSQTNRDGIGARVLVTASGKTQLREQNGGYHRWSQNHQRLHFGLGSNKRANVTVEWPSGTIDVHEGVSANAIYKVNEGGAIVKYIPDDPSPEVPLTDWKGAMGDVSASGNSIVFQGEADRGWVNQINSVRLSTLGFNDDYEIRFEIVGDPSSSLWAIGLGVNETGPERTDVDFAFRNVDGNVQLRRNGNWLDTVGEIKHGDVLSMYVSGGNLEFRKNAKPVFTVRDIGTPNFYVDSAFRRGSITLDVALVGKGDDAPLRVDIVDWVNPVGGVTSSGNTIAHDGASSDWENSINSKPMASLGAGSNFTVTWKLVTKPAGVNWVVGLGLNESGPSRTDVNYGLRNIEGQLQVRENGQWRASPGALAAGDILGLRVRGSTMEYLHNGKVIFESPIDGSKNFYIDTSFKDGAAKLDSFELRD